MAKPTKESLVENAGEPLNGPVTRIPGLTNDEVQELAMIFDQIKQMNMIGRWPLPPEQWNAIQRFMELANG